MKGTPKRWLFTACIAVLLLAAAFFCFVPSGGNRYRADATIIICPYTNVVFSPAFERQIVQAIPGVIRLRVSAGLSAVPGSGVPVITNSAAIQIFAVGATGPDAQRLANQAAISLCATSRQMYALSAEFVDKASKARPYSFLHDRLEPGIARLFKK